MVLNEISLTREKQSRILLDIFIGNEFITTTAGDGILVSTPTGSTAYALSAGGPIVLNGVNTITIVPIAPNSLAFRPICLPMDATIKIKVAHIQHR
jgi:NAD kinase